MSNLGRELTKDEHELIENISTKYNVAYSIIASKYIYDRESIEDIEEYCKRNVTLRKLNIPYQIQKEIISTLNEIDKYTKSINALNKIGKSLDSDIITKFNKDREHCINLIQHASDYKLLVKINKQGKAKIIINKNKKWHNLHI